MDVYFWRQLFILSAGLLYSVCVGFMLGFPAVLNSAILASNNTDIKTTGDQASWITASNGIAGILGSFILSPILQMFGRKPAHIGINLMLFIGWLIFPLAKDVIALYAARMVQGLTIGGIYINSIIICEYVHPSRRGYFITMKKVSIAVGTLCCHAMGAIWSWRQIAFFAAAPSLLAIVLTFFWPESPSYLALKGKYDQSERSFKWLNGHSPESQQHLKTLLHVQMRKRELSANRKNTLIVFLKKFLQKDFLKSFFIVSALTLAIDLCGRYYFVAYVMEIMMQLLGDRSSALCLTLSADALTVAALATSTLVITHFNRRTLLFYFGALSAALMLLISLLVYLKSLYEFPRTMLWLIALLIIFQCFLVNIGVIPVSFALIGEIFPLEHKGIGSFSSGIVFTSFYALTLKLTPVLMTHLGLHGTYAVYAVALLVCLWLVHKVLPETKDKTLQEIEWDLKGERNVMEDRSLIVTN